MLTSLRRMGPAVDDRGPPAAFERPGEQVVLPPERERAHLPLGGVVVQAGAAVAQHRRQRSPLRQRLADRLGQVRLAGDPCPARPRVLVDCPARSGNGPPARCGTGVLHVMSQQEPTGNARWPGRSLHAAGNENRALVIPGGIASAREMAERPELDLYVPDLRHSSLAGTYLAAATTFAALFGRSPEGNRYTAGLHAEAAAFMQRTAWQTVQEYLGLELTRNQSAQGSAGSRPTTRRDCYEGAAGRSACWPGEDWDPTGAGDRGDEASVLPPADVTAAPDPGSPATVGIRAHLLHQ